MRCVCTYGVWLCFRSPVKVVCNLLDIPTQWVAVSSFVLLVYLIGNHIEDVFYFSVKIFFHSILSIFFASVEVVGVDNVPANGPVIFTGEMIPRCALRKVRRTRSLIHSCGRAGGCCAGWMSRKSHEPVRGRSGDDVLRAPQGAHEARKDRAAQLQLLLTGCFRVWVTRALVRASFGQVGFLIAEKSWNRPIIGHLARLAGAVPVARPQDSAIKGQGMVEIDGRNVKGYDTEFTKSFAPGDKLNVKGCMEPFRVAKVISDTELLLADDPEEELPKERVRYEIHKYKDQKAVFKKVHEHLARGESIGVRCCRQTTNNAVVVVLRGVALIRFCALLLACVSQIFPEGGSHDRTDLLPLKAGVAVISFGALEHYNVSVPIVPVGLNYFRGHRFRGRVVVEFGAPIRVSEDLYSTYRYVLLCISSFCSLLGGLTLPSVYFVGHSTNKKDACTQLLTEVEDGMRSVIVTAPNYDVLSMLYMARRLYMRTERKLTARERQDMNRRFAEGYKLLMNKYEGREPKEFVEMRKKLLDYSELLKTWGLRDYQVPTLTVQSRSQLFYQFMHMLLVFVLASIPTLLLNAPVGLLARVLSETERKKALKSSNVKVAARDVMLSKKILISLVAVPTLWISYAILLFCFTSLSVSISRCSAGCESSDFVCAQRSTLVVLLVTNRHDSSSWCS